MSTRIILATALAAGFLSASMAMAQTTPPPAATPSTPAPAATSTPAPASTGKKTMHTSTSGHHMAMHHVKMHHTMHASMMRGHMGKGYSRDGGDAAVDALNAQSLARAKGNPAQ